MFRTGVAPVPPTPGVVLLCALAVGVVALAADTIARRPDTTIAALGPTLVLFVLTGTLGTDDLRVPTTIAYVAAALVELTIANAARVEARRTWFTGRRLASDASVVRSAAAVGGAALLVGLVITPLVPGVDSAPVLRYRNSSGRVAGFGDYEGVSPLVDLRARLGERSNIELFRVDSPTWRSTGASSRSTASTAPPGAWRARPRTRPRSSATTRRTAPCASSSRSARSPTSGSRPRSSPCTRPSATPAPSPSRRP